MIPDRKSEVITPGCAVPEKKRETAVISFHLMPHPHRPQLNSKHPTAGEGEGRTSGFDGPSPTRPGASQTGRVGGNNCNQSGPLWKG